MPGRVLNTRIHSLTPLHNPICCTMIIPILQREKRRPGEDVTGSGHSGSGRARIHTCAVPMPPATVALHTSGPVNFGFVIVVILKLY